MVSVTWPGTDGCPEVTEEERRFMFAGIREEDRGWLVHKGRKGVVITVTLPEPTTMSGVRMWNYNASLEATYCGVKRLIFSLDESPLSPPQGHLCRKAPGPAYFDYSQTFCFRSDIHEERVGTPQIHWGRGGGGEAVTQEYEPPHLPCGFIYKFVITSTWGDRWYVGLNGIKMYNHQGVLVDVNKDNVFAVPYSVCELLDNENDPRTPDKLFDGVNDTFDDEHMWLVPWTQGQSAVVYIVFDEPVTLSILQLWNYSKTPPRGAREFELHIDDVLVYKGHVRKAPGPPADGVTDGVAPSFCQSVLFTNDKAVVARERSFIYTPDSKVCGRALHSISKAEEETEFIDAEKSSQQRASRPHTSVHRS